MRTVLSLMLFVENSELWLLFMLFVIEFCYAESFLYHVFLSFVFFFKQKTAYEMRISDWSSDVCSSDLQAYPQLSHRYYRIKARWFGVERLNWWDRNAPLPSDEDKVIPWPDAQRLVLDAYSAFSPDLGALGRRFFDSRWIDAPPRPGKAPGAFAHPTVPSAHPYLLLNYHGKTRDVMTLAHELEIGRAHV